MRPLALLLALTFALTACDREPAPAAEPAPPAAATALVPPTDFLFAEMDIADLQARMRAGELDSRTLTQAYLDRIAAIDKAGPQLNAIIEINPDALKEAALRDIERKGNAVRGPLHGIPILLKDNIDATPMVTSAGSLALQDFRPKTDAFLVRRLREAGAVVLGKTNLSEWANFRSTRSTSGWSARGGQTRNPYVLDRNPCGSSSGSAVAVSANLAAAAIGTETDGSILCPAAVNGLVGLKPTVGLVSRNGIVPISHSQDTAGPMTRSVADAALLLTVLAGRDVADAATTGSAWNVTLDYHARLRTDALKGARIGVLRSKFAIHPDAAMAMEAAIEVLREAGATVVDAEIPTDGQWDDAELELMLYEFKVGVERYLGNHDAPLKTLPQLIGFNQQYRTSEMPYFGQELFEMANGKGGLGDPAYIAARSLARRLAGPEGIDAALKAQKLDALIAPTTGPAWPTDYANGDRFPGAGYGAAAVAGYPSLTVPMGHSDGLPLGIVFMGTAWSEPRLIELGFAYEQLTRARKPPEYWPSLQKPARPAAN
ncbi:amidase [Pseudoxanthomonas wuyuanensis]|uniref:Amidase n=1 Tax=Pseudoxanthomonas wuyuanensis TaxID=1073196 RepID=A0A286D7H7_9GAMM|nr:amidase [Pseudoxanthomonas wuyuanensis]KAF1719031.1 amidase [Pseudoxanthomonas wuyuanensis]SOD54595.1 amidase [Pseudoxanthomonas wuyuanensis]